MGGSKINKIYHPFPFGSLNYLNFEAELIDNVLYLVMPDNSFDSLNIVCKPNYNIDTILNFMENNLSFRVYYEIVVENEFKEIGNESYFKE